RRLPWPAGWREGPGMRQRGAIMAARAMHFFCCGAESRSGWCDNPGPQRTLRYRKRDMALRSQAGAGGLGLKLRPWATSACEGPPKVFRQRNSQRFIMEISKAELASAAAATPAQRTPSTPLSGDAPIELRGAEILVKALQAEGVKHVWGYPGGAVLHIYD